MQRILHEWSFQVGLIKRALTSHHNYDRVIELSYDYFKQSFISLKVEITPAETMSLSGMASWRYAPVTKH